MINNQGRVKTAGQILLIDTNLIFPNKNQPRKSFSSEELEQLSTSIRRNGVIQPLTVRKMGDAFELIAGERRLRAAKAANLRSVPCIVMEADEQSSAVISLLENIQRSQLNFLEEAKAIQTLAKYYGMKQEDIASSLGMSQANVSNLLRILRLTPEALIMLAENSMTQRHARALLKLEPQEQIQAAKQICEKKMTVSAAEKLVENILNEKNKPCRIRKIFFNDVKIFINTINHAIETMQNAGIEAFVSRSESEDGCTITINVPKAKRAVGDISGKQKCI